MLSLNISADTQYEIERARTTNNNDIFVLAVPFDFIIPFAPAPPGTTFETNRIFAFAGVLVIA